MSFFVIDVTVAFGSQHDLVKIRLDIAVFTITVIISLRFKLSQRSFYLQGTLILHQKIVVILRIVVLHLQVFIGVLIALFIAQCFFIVTQRRLSRQLQAVFVLCALRILEICRRACSFSCLHHLLCIHCFVLLIIDGLLIRLDSFEEFIGTS